jgi:hypothetical protein
LRVPDCPGASCSGVNRPERLGDLLRSTHWKSRPVRELPWVAHADLLSAISDLSMEAVPAPVACGSFQGAPCGETDNTRPGGNSFYYLRGSWTEGPRLGLWALCVPDITVEKTTRGFGYGVPPAGLRSLRGPCIRECKTTGRFRRGGPPRTVAASGVEGRSPTRGSDDRGSIAPAVRLLALTFAIASLGMVACGGDNDGEAHHIEVPALFGQSVTAARGHLERLGLKMHVKRRHDRTPVDTVIGEAPTWGERAQKGDTVTVLLSSGPPWAPPTGPRRFHGYPDLYRNAKVACSSTSPREVIRYWAFGQGSDPSVAAHAFAYHWRVQFRRAAFEGCLAAFTSR